MTLYRHHELVLYRVVSPRTAHKLIYDISIDKCCFYPEAVEIVLIASSTTSLENGFLIIASAPNAFVIKR